MKQTITDMINVLLYDKQQTQYINKFSINMVGPMTEEDKNRQENLSSEIQVASDVMNLLGDIDDPVIKLKLLKALLSSCITNEEVIELIQEQIDELEAEQEGSEESSSEEQDINIDFSDEGESSSSDFSGGLNDFASDGLDLGNEAPSVETSVPEENGGEETVSGLPSMNEIGLDFADTTQF